MKKDFWNGNIAVLRSAHDYDLERLRKEAARAMDLQGFDAGAYGHSISVPAAEQIDERFRAHTNNQPYADALGSCPYLAEIFNGFTAAKSSFRLLRRGPHSAYSLHDDKDKGVDVIRLQIPIITNDRAYLGVSRVPATKLDVFAEKKELFDPGENGEWWFDMAKAKAAWGDDLAFFQLLPGRLYFFDTNRVHTLINAGDAERVTLAIDLVLDEALARWIETELVEHEPEWPNSGSPEIRWRWDALRHGIITN